ncbi:MAG: hypothetical protein VXW87_03270 [Pseudomonadota bacterium]|nr:hypothetical protein [Pseudomonadota bacterium]
MIDKLLPIVAKQCANLTLDADHTLDKAVQSFKTATFHQIVSQAVKYPFIRRTSLSQGKVKQLTLPNRFLSYASIHPLIEMAYAIECNNSTATQQSSWLATLTEYVKSDSRLKLDGFDKQLSVQAYSYYDRAWAIQLFFSFLISYAKECRKVCDIKKLDVEKQNSFIQLEKNARDGQASITLMLINNDYQVDKIHAIFQDIMSPNVIAALAQVGQFIGIPSDLIQGFAGLREINLDTVNRFQQIHQMLQALNSESSLVWSQQNIQHILYALVELSQIDNQQYMIFSRFIAALPFTPLSLYSPLLDRLYNISSSSYMRWGNEADGNQGYIQNMARVISQYFSYEGPVSSADVIARRLSAIGLINPQATNYLVSLYHQLLRLTSLDQAKDKAQEVVQMLYHFANLDDEAKSQSIQFLSEMLNSSESRHQEYFFIRNLRPTYEQMAQSGLLVQGVQTRVERSIAEVFDILSSDISTHTLHEVNRVLHSMPQGLLPLLTQPIFSLPTSIKDKVNLLHRLQNCDEGALNNIIEAVSSIGDNVLSIPRSAAQQVSNLSLESPEGLIYRLANASQTLSRVQYSDIITVLDALEPLDGEASQSELSDLTLAASSDTRTLLLRYDQTTSIPIKFLLKSYLLSDFYQELFEISRVVAKISQGGMNNLVDAASLLSDIADDRFQQLLDTIWLNQEPNEAPPLYQKLQQVKRLSVFHIEVASIVNAYTSLSASIEGLSVVDRVFSVLNDIREIDKSRFKSLVDAVLGEDSENACDQSFCPVLLKVHQLAHKLPESQMDEAKKNVKELIKRGQNAVTAAKNHLLKSPVRKGIFDIFNYAKSVNIAKNTFVGLAFVGMITIMFFPASYLIVCPLLVVSLLVVIGLFVAELIKVKADVDSIDSSHQILQQRPGEHVVEYAIRMTQAVIAPDQDPYSKQALTAAKSIASDSLIPVTMGVVSDAVEGFVAPVDSESNSMTK